MLRLLGLVPLCLRHRALPETEILHHLCREATALDTTDGLVAITMFMVTLCLVNIPYMILFKIKTRNFFAASIFV